MSSTPQASIHWGMTCSSDVLRFEVGGCDRHDALEESDRLLQSLHRIQQHVLVLDRQPAIVAGHLEPVAEMPPPLLALAEAQGDVGPAARRDIHQAPALEKRRRRLDGSVQKSVLGVN